MMDCGLGFDVFLQARTTTRTKFLLETGDGRTITRSHTGISVGIHNTFALYNVCILDYVLVSGYQVLTTTT